MPSVFPGMDPYIEGQAWPDFHLLMLGEIRRVLTPLLRPRYVVRADAYNLDHERGPEPPLTLEEAALAEQPPAR